MAASSPVNLGDLIIPSSGVDLCAAIRAITQAIAVLRADLDYRVEETRGEHTNVPTFEFARAIGAMVIPPGSIMAFKVSGSSADHAALQAALNDTLAAGWGTIDTEAEEVPWFYLCNGEHGTPNLVGRFIMCAGTVSETETYAANSTGGAKDVTLGNEHTPDHDHKLGAYGTAIHATETANDMLFKDIAAATVAEFSGALLHTNSDGGSSRTASTVNKVTLGVHSEIPRVGDDEQTPVPTLPPYVALVYAMRSTRMV